MGYLSSLGKFVIILSVAGFLYGLYLAYSLAAASVALVSIFGLLGGMYVVGYLGIKVEEMGSNDYTDYGDLSERTRKLEGEKGEDELQLPKVVRAPGVKET
jgi:hypothetical protein